MLVVVINKFEMYNCLNVIEVVLFFVGGFFNLRFYYLVVLLFLICGLIVLSGGEKSMDDYM